MFPRWRWPLRNWIKKEEVTSSMWRGGEKKEIKPCLSFQKCHHLCKFCPESGLILTPPFPLLVSFLPGHCFSLLRSLPLIIDQSPTSTWAAASLQPFYLFFFISGQACGSLSLPAYDAYPQFLVPTTNPATLTREAAFDWCNRKDWQSVAL